MIFPDRDQQNAGMSAHTFLRGARFYIALVALLTACGGSDTTGSKPPNEPQGPPLSSLEIFPTELIAQVGETMTPQVTARDLSGAIVPNLVPHYTSSNPTIVSVDANRHRLQAMSVGIVTVHASAGGQVADMIIHVGSAAYNLAALGPPRVLNANFIDLSRIKRISRFRSTVGHSYVDTSGETCRSMKHYFEPYDSVDWTTVDIFAPASGTILEIAPDGAWGSRVVLRPESSAALRVAIFHVTVDSGIVKNSWVEAGQHIGRHASGQTLCDIAVSIGGKEEGTLISYFDAMTDEVFAQYQARGVANRQALIITRAQRDADPVPCVDEHQFTVHGHLPDWVLLN